MILWIISAATEAAEPKLVYSLTAIGARRVKEEFLKRGEPLYGN
jgi:hypothetical protein